VRRGGAIATVLLLAAAAVMVLPSAAGAHGHAAATRGSGVAPNAVGMLDCNGVSKSQIADAVTNNGCATVSKVGACTKAGMGCGSCKGLVAQIIESCLGEVKTDPSEHYYVPGVPLEKSQLVAEIRSRGLKSVSAVFRELAGGKEDVASKAGLASLLNTLWPGEYEDERDARSSTTGFMPTFKKMARFP